MAVPKLIADAIAAGTWRDCGPEVLRQLLGEDLELPDLQLFESAEAMRGVSVQLDSGGYVDDPQFCMVRREADLVMPGDVRLVFERALCIAGSTVPGDDVIVAVQVSNDEDDPNILVFDWRKPVPDRWIVRGRLSDFVQGLAAGTSA
jgi:hypothetical protein